MRHEWQVKMGLFATSFTGWILKLHQLVPHQLDLLSLVALLFGIADYITGVAASATAGTLSSSEARRRTVSKLAQFFALVSLGAGTSILTGSWVWLGAAWSGIVSIEAMSILENMVRLERTGVRLGPVRPLLTRLSTFFSQGDSNAVQIQSPGEGLFRQKGPELELPRDGQNDALDQGAPGEGGA